MNNRASASLDHELYEMQARICKAFANSTRLRMLDLLGTGEMRASDLQERLGVSAPNVSQHVAILKAAGVVSTRRDGKHIYCSLAMPEVKSACAMVRDVLRRQLSRSRALSLRDPVPGGARKKKVHEATLR